MIAGREKGYDFCVYLIFFIEKYTLIRYNCDM